MKHPNDRKRPNSTESRADFIRSRTRYFHVSAKIIRNPASAIAEAKKLPFFGPHVIAAPGTTLHARRNAMKSKKRSLMEEIAGSVRAFRRRMHSRSVTA